MHDHKIGRTNFETIQRDLSNMCNEICEMINDKFQDIHICGKPKLSTFGIQSNTINVHFLNKLMTDRGWKFASLMNNENKAGMHYTLTKKELLVKNQFIVELMNDLQTSIDHIKTHPQDDPGLMAKMYCSTQEIPTLALGSLKLFGQEYIKIQNMVTNY